MSATTPHNTCDTCGTAEPVSELVQPTPNNNYCSTECYYRHRGEKALRQVRADHRFCSSCGRTVKEVDTPPTEFTEQLKHENGPETAEAVVGFQDRTPEADTGVKEYQGMHEASRLYREGTICSCGVTDLREQDETLQETEWKTVLVNYVETFWELEETGAIQQRLDRDTFITTYYKTKDLELALGKGLYGR